MFHFSVGSLSPLQELVIGFQVLSTTLVYVRKTNLVQEREKCLQPSKSKRYMQVQTMNIADYNNVMNTINSCTETGQQQQQQMT